MCGCNLVTPRLIGGDRRNNFGGFATFATTRRASCRFVMDKDLTRLSACSCSSAFAGSFVADPYLDLGEVFQEREQDAV
jgi:hypothetical protein